MSNITHRFHIIDSHTGGEPTRMVYDGFPALSGATLSEKLQDFKTNYDHLRKAIILEPRGCDVLVGALLCEPDDEAADFGVIFFNNEAYLGMCGHGTIGVIASLFYQGKIDIGEHCLQTPVGLVKAILHTDGKVSICNVPSYRYQKAVSTMVPELGKIQGDIAWGGNWFFLVSNHGQNIQANNIKQLTEVSLAIRNSLIRDNITGKNGEEIDHIELFGDSDVADSRSFVLCPGGAYDRSPCGTGTSAKVACLAADDKLAENQLWRQQSVIGSIFEARYVFCDEHNESNAIIPTITGQAFISGENTLICQDDDPFAYGIE